MTASAAVLISLCSRRWGPRFELGVGYVASALSNAGYSVYTVLVSDDAEEGIDVLKDVLKHKTPKLIGFGCSHSVVSISVYRQIAQECRRISPSAHITCGGYSPTFNARRFLQNWPELDSVVVGEGEQTAVDLMTALAHNQSPDNCLGLLTRTNQLIPRPSLANLDLLQFPERTAHGLPESALVPISTSRGCLAHCTFCNVPKWTSKHGGGWRGRSASNVVNEMEELHRKHKARRFWIVDSSYEDPLPEGFTRISQIADEIIERGLPISYYVFFRAESIAQNDCQALLLHLIHSGLRRVFIGVESGNPGDLRKYGKKANLDDMRQALERLRACGLATRIGFIMFHPRNTFDDLRANLAFLMEIDQLGSAADLMTRLELYTGAAEVAQLRNEGLLVGDPWNDPYAYRFGDPRIEKLAQALTRTRSENRPERRWESIHTARLVAQGSLLTDEVREHPVLFRLAQNLLKEVNELWAFISASNRVLFETLLDLAEDGWKEDTYRELVSTHIDGYCVDIAKTCDTLVRVFLLQAYRENVNVVF